MEPFQQKTQKKKKEKPKNNKRSASKPTDDDDLDVSSSQSFEETSYSNGNGNAKAESPSYLESTSDNVNPYEVRLSEALDQLTEKRGSTREGALKTLNEILSLVYSDEFVSKNQMTLKESLKKCLRGGTTERELAARTLSLVSITEGPNEELFNFFSPILCEMSKNSDNPLSVREKMIECLSILCFVSISDEEIVNGILQIIEDLIQLSDQDASQQQFLTTCLISWNLLVSSLSPETIADTVLPRFGSDLNQLMNLDLNLEFRQQVGEAIALQVEAYREMQGDDFDFDQIDGFIDVNALLLKLDELAEESNRYQAKKDRSKQKSLFKTIRSSIEFGITMTEDLTIQHQSVHFEGWAQLCQLNMFRQVLSIGFQHHFRDNEMLHEIFGQSINKNQSATRFSQIEKRHLKSSQSEESKHRSKDKTKQMKQRAAALAFDGDD